MGIPIECGRSTSQLYLAVRDRRYSFSEPISEISKARTSLRPLTLSRSLKTSLHCGHAEEKLDSCRYLHKFPENFSFPIVVCQSGSFSRYVWDGTELKLVSVDGTSEFSVWDFFLNYEDGLRRLGRACGSAVRNFFLPRQVSDNYLEYVRWKFLHRVFSSALQVLATQAMFRAIGIGFSRSLPSAAAINWVMKDGLGRLSRCIYTATLASSFDTNLKRVRFSTSVLFSLSIGVELLTPFFPNYFLLLATIANIAKQISLACHLATGSAVHRSFAVADNLGEISAKSQIQTVCFDNIGLLLAATLNVAFGSNQRLLAGLPFIAYPIFSAIDLFGIYQGLKYVHLQTLTKNRLELVINIWSQQGYVPSPAQVSQVEGINVFWNQDVELLPIRIGCLNPKRNIPKLSMMTMRSLSDEDFYFTCMESFNGQYKIKDLGILLCLREGSGTLDIIMGLLQACYIQKGLLFDMVRWENWLEACDDSDSILGEWCALMEEGKRFAHNNHDLLSQSMSSLGWACKNILLNAHEQRRYSFVAD